MVYPGEGLGCTYDGGAGPGRDGLGAGLGCGLGCTNGGGADPGRDGPGTGLGCDPGCTYVGGAGLGLGGLGAGVGKVAIGAKGFRVGFFVIRGGLVTA